MYYVYVLQSEKDESRYIGVTEDLKRRLLEHNGGNSRYSNTKRPFKIVGIPHLYKKAEPVNLNSACIERFILGRTEGR